MAEQRRAKSNLDCYDHEKVCWNRINEFSFCLVLLTTSIFYYRVYHQILTLLKEALLGKFLKLILFKLSIDNSLILGIQIMKSNRGPNAFVCNKCNNYEESDTKLRKTTKK